MGFSAAVSLKRLACAAALAFGVAAAAPPASAELSPTQKREIETVIKDYLLKNPEVLRDALTELDRRQKDEEATQRAKAVSDNAAKLYSSPHHAIVGNPKGSVTVVEFFDYNCGYCKKALDDLTKLMKTDASLRVVLKDFPVLGPGSVEAAQVAQAVKLQLKGDQFWTFHQKLLNSRGQVGKAQALAAARDSGVDMDRLAKDMENPKAREGIEETMQLADALALTGTPSYVVGNEVVVGAVGYDALKSRIDNVRKCGQAAC